MATLINGDCLDKLRQLEDNSVDSIVTDPPYGLGFMGKSWDTFDNSQFGKAGKEGENDLKVKKNFNILPRYNTDGLYDFTKEWAAECLRVLKPGGYILSFAGSRTYHKICMGIEDAGFEIRDQIMWVYGSGFPKSRNLGDGWGSALKPAHEPIVMARKPFKGSLTKNHNTYGTGGINIDGCRVGTGTGEMKVVEYPDITGDNYNQGKGNYSDRGKVTYEVEDKGRYPANFIHDGSDEVVSQFPDSKTSKSKLPKGTGGIWSDTSNTPCGPTYDGEGSAARFFYCPKASKKDRNAGCEGLDDKEWSHEGAAIPERANRPFIPSKNNHPTVKPQALMAYLCRLVTQPNGVVLDPFMGSGSTGRAALSEGFDFIGIEREPEYFQIAQARVTNE